MKSFKKDRREKEQGIKEVKESISTLNKRLDDLDSAMDRKKQCSPRNCHLLHSIKEESNENTNQRVIVVLSKSVGETISIQDSDGTHILSGGGKWVIKGSNFKVYT